MQFDHLRVDLIRGLRHAQNAAGNLRGLEHDLGRDALVDDGLLLVRGGHEFRDDTAVEMFVGDHPANENNADADRKAELRAYSGFEGKFEARHPGWNLMTRFG